MVIAYKTEIIKIVDKIFKLYVSPKMGVSILIHTVGVYYQCQLIFVVNRLPLLVF